MNEPKAVSLIAIHAHGIPDRIPQGSDRRGGEARKPVDPRGRTDLRKFPLVTIDPEDARDHDDAVWAGPDDDPANPGGHIAIVAIADVAHYVTPGSALDREALKRGNSVYFPDRVVPMLPERLSADLCSLKEGVDRPCLAVRMMFDKHGKKTPPRIPARHHALGRRGSPTRRRSAPSTASRMRQSALCAKPLADLWAAYQALAKARDARDPLDSICRSGAS